MFTIFLGHLMGDYFCQDRGMGTHKKDKTLKGLWLCSLHCFIYTLWILMFNIKWLNGWIFAFIFMSHFIIDRGPLILWWMRFKERDKTLYPAGIDLGLYIVQDNMVHLISLWLIGKYLVPLFCK